MAKVLKASEEVIVLKNWGNFVDVCGDLLGAFRGECGALVCG